MRKQIVYTVVCVFLAATSFASAMTEPRSTKQHREFRNDVLAYVNNCAGNILDNLPLPSATRFNEHWDRQYAHAYWYITITLFDQGQLLGQGTATTDKIAQTLCQATRLALTNAGITAATKVKYKALRVIITFSYPPDNYYSFISYQGNAYELMGGRIPLRLFETNQLKQQIAASQRYLMHVMNPQFYGFYKVYQAKSDQDSTLLRTIYSASSLYSFIKLYRYNHDQALEKNFRKIAGFLLSMQVKNGKNAGGFYYAYNIKTDKKTCKLVAGTASKTIFTLLELYEFYHDEVYLNAAQKAGDWLLTMVQSDGSVWPEAICVGDQWHYVKKQSFLYSGQVLSALSRLAAVTHAKRYYQGASLIAGRINEQVRQQNYFVGDDFRAPNTVSTSWVAMSLTDYARINHAPWVRDTIKQAVDQVLARQINNPHDVYNYGRYLDTMTTSGNGWINEVFTELYRVCLRDPIGDCNRLREAVIKTSRWLLQNAYTEINAYALKNPANAIGGFIRNYVNPTVRTDAVCHGVNSLVNLAEITGSNNETIILPEQRFEETIGLLRIGKGL
ncbi:hypothetical protein ACFORL_12720 [Legionella dresdenensis]|uniref:Glycosyl hydrolase family 76 n=1 Tax=Legionella dresdenensis TaxID=450200 RepID=A0ABV8CI30_9GAMM